MIFSVFKKQYLGYLKLSTERDLNKQIGKNLGLKFGNFGTLRVNISKCMRRISSKIT